jgi:hypothetical protein
VPQTESPRPIFCSKLEGAFAKGMANRA